MELTIVSEAKEPLYKRVHLTLGVSYEGATPSRGEIASNLAEQREVGTDRVAIRRIESRFGGGSATADAYVYDDAAALTSLEHEHLTTRTGKGLGPAKTEAHSAPAAAPEEPAAAPAEPAEPAAEEAPLEKASDSAEAEPAAEDESKDE